MNEFPGLDLAVSALGIFCLVVLWRLLIRPALMDRARDQLFDLRDELREKFETKGWGLEHPIYKELRSLINTNLRYIEQVTFLRVILLVALLGSNKEAQIAINADLNRRFMVNRPDIQLFADEMRVRCATVVIDWTLFSSSFMLFAVFIATLLKLIAAARNVAGRKVSSTISGVRMAIQEGAFSLSPSVKRVEQIVIFDSPILVG